jgi:hypothetical protein
MQESEGSIRYVFTQAAAPTGEGEQAGSLWYDTTNKILSTYNGVSWEAVTSGSNFATATLKDATHQWDFNDALTDSIGSLTLSGTANYSATAKFGTKSQDVNNATANALTHATFLDAMTTDYGSTGFTICGFIRFDAVGANMVFLDKNSDANDAIRITLNGGTNKCDFKLAVGGVEVTLTPNQVCTTGVWYHFGFSVAANGDFIAVIDDVSASDTSTFAAIPADDSSYDFTLGKYNKDNNEPLNGLLDSIVFYPYNLSASELEDLGNRSSEDENQIQTITAVREVL